MELYPSHHDWNLLQQDAPKADRPYGFVCSCGEVRTALFASAREALRDAEHHGIRRAPAERRAA
jgi:hypothetical protein